MTFALASMPQGSLYEALGRIGVANSRPRPMPRVGGDDESRRRYVAQRGAFALLRYARRLSFPATLDNALAHLMIYGFIMPIAIALSIRNLPLFMHLPTPPKQSLFPLFVLYVIGVTCRTIDYLEHKFWLPNFLGDRYVTGT